MPLQIVITDSNVGAIVTYSATGLPPGLSINSVSGIITGIPTTLGTYTTTVTGTDNFGASGSVQFTWFIVSSGGGNTITVTNPGNQVSVQNALISALQISATDSDVAQTLTYSATGLPTGLSISSSGLITGTPTKVGNFSVTVTATDTTSATGTAVFSWTVTTATGNTVTVNNPGNQSNNVGSVISLQISASDSASGQTLTFAASGLPSGLSINSTSGLITGTITGAAQTYTPTITVTDTTNATGTASFTWTVVTGVNTVTVNNPGNQSKNVGSVVSLQIIASDSASGQTLTYSATGLPAGLTINASTGLISGTLTTVQTRSVRVTAIDTTGVSGFTIFTYTVNAVTTTFVPRVGCSIPNQTRNNAGCYDSGVTPYAASDTTFVNIVNRPAGGSHLLCTKKFWGPAQGKAGVGQGWTDLGSNDMANYQRFGTRVICCLQPGFPGDIFGNTTYPDDNALQSFLASLRNLGFPSTQIIIVHWQEPEVGNRVQPSQWAGILEHYGPVHTRTASLATDGKPYQIVSDVGTGGGLAKLQGFAAATIVAYNTGLVPLLGLAQDFYCPQYQNGARLGDTASMAATADANNLPFGVFECGASPFQLAKTYFGGNLAQGKAVAVSYMTYIHDFMLGRLNAGKKNLDIMYYGGQCSPIGSGDLTSPIGQDPSYSPMTSDARIALYQKIFDDCSG